MAETVKEQLAQSDAQKLPIPEQSNERDRQDFADEFAKNLINRLQEQAEDEGFTDDDGEPLKLWYAERDRETIQSLRQRVLHQQ